MRGVEDYGRTGVESFVRETGFDPGGLATLLLANRRGFDLRHGSGAPAYHTNEIPCASDRASVIVNAHGEAACSNGGGKAADSPPADAAGLKQYRARTLQGGARCESPTT